MNLLYNYSLWLIRTFDQRLYGAFVLDLQDVETVKGWYRLRNLAGAQLFDGLR